MEQEFDGLSLQNSRDFNLCLLASWIKRYHLDSNKLVGKLLILNMIYPQMLCGHNLLLARLFGKVLFVRLVLRSTIISEKLGEGIKCCSGATFGLVMQSCNPFLGCLVFLMNNKRLYVKLVIE
jgi:hypothetical protein